MSPTHTRRRGRLYRYYVSQSALKGQDNLEVVRRVSAAAIERAVIDQMRALLSQPEVIVGTSSTNQSCVAVAAENLFPQTAR